MSAAHRDGREAADDAGTPALDAAPPARDAFASARDAVVAVCRTLAADGLVLGSAGNVSTRAADGRIAVTATGARLATITPDQVTIVDDSGAPLPGELAPTSELGLHLAIYAERGDGAGAVIHTHAPVATALGCVLDGEVPLIHYGMLAFGGAIRIAPYFTFGSDALARATLAALEGRTAALMASHGTVNVGASLDAALDGVRQLEWFCTLYWRAAQLGDPHVLTPAEVQDVIDTVVRTSYGTTHR